jgi:hypothetical protein
LLEEFRIQGLNLETGMEFGFAKFFSKASKIPRLLAAGIFLFDENIFSASPNYLWLSQPHHFYRVNFFKDRHSTLG